MDSEVSCTNSPKIKRARGDRLARLVGYIQYTTDYKQSCHGVHKASDKNWGWFQDAAFVGNLTDPSVYARSLGVILLFQYLEFAKNRLRFLTAVLKHKSFRLMRAYEQMGHCHGLTPEDWS